MKTISRLGLSLAAVVASAALSASPVSAMYQQQSQSFSNETSFSSNCDGGNCGGSHEFSSSTEMSQSQAQSTGSVSFNDDGFWGGHRGNKRNNWNTTKPAKNTDGEVRINWDFRGGTCNIRYTESTTRNWNYNTSANCDDGGKTIGGLQKGKNYRFQVRKDDGAWTRSRTIKAQ